MKRHDLRRALKQNKSQIERIGQIFARQFQKTKSLVSAVQEIYRDCDEQLDEISQQVRFDCQLGCNYCCHGQVTATLPEVIAVADYVSERLPDRKAELTERVVEADKITRGKGIGHRHRCPFLGRSGQCDIYPIRPMNCRLYVSMSVEPCREQNVAVVPEWWTQVRLIMCWGLIDGAKRVLKKSVAATELFDFNHAMQIALTSPDAISKAKRSDYSSFRDVATFAKVEPDTQDRK